MAKRGKQEVQPRIVQLGPDTLSNHETQDTPPPGKNNVTRIVRSISIRAPLERCFELITRQLEKTPDWDPMIMQVDPISIKHVRVGSMSRVAFNLSDANAFEEAIAMIRFFRPNKAISWASTHSTRLQEEWQVQHQPSGTIVTLILGYNPTGSLLRRLASRISLRRQLEKAVSETLENLKATAERPQ